MTSGRPLRIFHAVSSRFLTGPGLSVIALAERQQRAGMQVAFTCEAGGPLDEAAREAGLPVRNIGLGRKGHPAAVRAAAREMAQLDVDIIHVHRSSDHAAAVWGRGRASVVRSMYATWAKPPGLWRRLSLSLLGSRTDALTVVTESMAGAVRRHLSGWGGKVWHVPGGVDLQRFRPGEAPGPLPEPWPVPPGVPLFGMAAKLSSKARKIDQVVRAWGLLRVRTNHPFRAVILGDEGQLRPIQALIDAAGLAGVVFAVHSRPSGTDGAEEFFRSAMGRIDVGVQLAPGSDGACRATLEMMALGRPSAVYGTGALRELVVDGRTGLAAPPNDVHALAGCMARLLEDRALRERFGTAARARAEGHFSLDTQVERMARVYHAVLHANSIPG